MRLAPAIPPLALSCALAAACSEPLYLGGHTADGGAPDAGAPPPALRGTVWAPGNAPGMVAPGFSIPVAGALVYVSAGPPEPIPQEVYCDRCVAPPWQHALSGADGSFVLEGVAPGTYWLVIQKGQFRLDQQIVVPGGEDLVLDASWTTLPSVHDPDGGKWVPRIALAEGLWDDMEDILGKMDIGEVDGDGAFVGASAAGNFDLYINGSGDHGNVAIDDLPSLIADLERMKEYHLIFVPCSDGDNSELFTDPTLRANIREYVNLGGKFYVTDWSAEWEDVVFPEFIEFVSGHDTPAGATPAQFNDGDDYGGYESEHALAEDADLHAWLDGQLAPLIVEAGEYGAGAIDAGDFVVEGNWDHIQRLPTIELGYDEKGFPIEETAHVWVKGDWDPGEGAVHPLTVTFEPIGCGRVLYSTYHTADNVHVGLLPQERVLLYLVMQIGICSDNPIIK